MNKKLVVILVIIVTALISMSFFLKPEKTTENNKIKIGYREHVAYAPLFVGLEQNIFAKYGLEIEPIKFESTNQMMDAMLAGQIDASLGGINSLVLLTVEEKSPGEIKIFSLTSEASSTPFLDLIIPTNSSIASIYELEGKNIGLYPGSFGQAIYNRVISKYFDPQKSNLIQTAPNLQLQTLESGRVDASFVLEPLAAVAKNKGLAKILESAIFAKYYFDKTPIAASAVSKKFINNYPELTDKLIRATAESIEYINNNIFGAKQAISIHTKIEDNVLNLISLPIFESITPENITRLQNLADLFLEDELLTNKANVSEIVLYDKIN